LSRSSKHLELSLAIVIGLALLASPAALAQSETIDAAYLATMRQRSLAADAIGDFKLQVGDPTGARSAYLEGLALARQVLAAEPENTQWQADVVVSLWRVAAATTDRSAKISSLQEALGFVDKLESRGALGANQRNWRAMIEAEIAKPAEQQPVPAQRRRRSAHTADEFGARQH
jgi:hypothetical protein